MILRKEYRFEAAHFLHNHPNKCRNLHGHSYKLLVYLNGHVDVATGMVMDFGNLSDIVTNKIINHLDHTFLNDIIPLPTAENIVSWIWNELQADLPNLYQLELFETPDNSVIYRK